MSPRRTRRGTVRESVSEISINSSLKSTSKPPRSSRRDKNKSQPVKGADEDSDSPVEVNSLVHNVTSTSALDTTATTARKRRRKGQEVSINQDSSFSSTICESKSKSSTSKGKSKTPKSTRQVRSSKSVAVSADSLISEDESFEKKNQRGKRKASIDLISEDEDIPKATPAKKVKSQKQKSSKKKEHKTPEKSSPRVTLSNLKSSDAIVTPKTSPLNVSFTPHRSKKTPKKSPVNLGSPKTHSHHSLRLLNVPRKLSIEASPPSSEKSNNSLHQTSSSNIGNESTETASNKRKGSKTASKLASNKKKSISPILKVKSRFSKSPKIVPKILVSKSTKSSRESPKQASSSALAKKSHAKSPSKEASSSTLSKESPAKSPKEASSSILSKKSPAKSPPTRLSSRTLLTKSPQKSKKLSKTVSPVKVEKSSTPSKVKSTSKAASPKKSLYSNLSIKIENAPKPISPKKSKADKNASPSGKQAKSVLLDKSHNSPTVVVSPLNLKKASKDLSVRPKKVSPKSTSSLKSKDSLNDSSHSKSKISTKSFTPSISKKMPKIFLALKSKKSVTPSKFKKTPSKLSKSISPLKSKKTPSKLSKSISPSKSKKSPKIVSSKIQKVKLSNSKSANVSSNNSSMSPRVLMNKLSSPQLKRSSLTAKENQPSVNLIPVDAAAQPPVVRGKSAKSPKSPAKNKSQMKTVSTPGSLVKTHVNASKRPSAVNSNFKSRTPSLALEKKLQNLKPRKTSTPRVTPREFKRTLHSESNKKELTPKHSSSSVILNGSAVPRSKAIKRLNNQSKIKAAQPLLEDESEPSMNDSSLIHMSDVFDSDNSQQNDTFEMNKSNLKTPAKRKSKSPQKNSSTFEIKKNSSNTSSKDKSPKDDTYEVEHPKTPGFPKKSKKRTSQEAGLSNEGRESKKSKVHFASPNLRNKVRSSGITRIGTPGHAAQQKRTSTITTKKPVDQALKNKIEAKRISAVSKLQGKTPSTPVNKRLSISSSNSAVKSARKSITEQQLASVNRLSKPKVNVNLENKLEVKTPVAKKIPNFAEIHQKNFSKMESIVDLKKRVENRHINHATSSAKKIQPADPTNGAYNRFGFKLRKDDAVNIVMKKRTGSVMEKQRAAARSALKGVRMNRRFELQMKARNKKS